MSSTRATTTTTSTTAQRTRKPAEFLKGVTGRPITVKLNSGVEYRGVLACVDGFFNVAMEQTEEFVDGVRKAQLGDAFIRGNNVLYMAKQE